MKTTFKKIAVAVLAIVGAVTLAVGSFKTVTNHGREFVVLGVDTYTKEPWWTPPGENPESGRLVLRQAVLAHAYDQYSEAVFFDTTAGADSRHSTLHVGDRFVLRWGAIHRLPSSSQAAR
jgi:hypothetical protein